MVRRQSAPNHTRQVAEHAIVMSAQDGLVTQAVWQTSRVALAKLLGNRTGRFANAIEGFDFDAVLYVLKTAKEGHYG